ncbi:hypothetical protein [Streptomyces sp. NPDC002573]|uniref:hypothetical protein n=1 Tax=Streptomyces sp. NPDC002573 TaxID=3364651 RepID=UPI003676AC02
MQSSDLARRALDALSAGPAATRNDPVPRHLLDRHPPLRGAWQSWRENPARAERATALRVALDEALDRDAELRLWAERLVTNSQAPCPAETLIPPWATATAPQPPARPPHPPAAPPVPPAAPYPPGPAAAPTPPGPPPPPYGPQPYYRQRRFQIAALALVLALIGVGSMLALTGTGSGSAGSGGLHHRFALGVQGHRTVNAQVDVTVGEATRPQCAGHAAKGTVYPVTITIHNTGPVSWDTSETPEDDVQPSLHLSVQGANPGMLVGTDFPVRGDKQHSGSAGCTGFEDKQRDALGLAVGQRASWTTEVDTAQRAPGDEEFLLAFEDSTGTSSAGETWSFRGDGSHQGSRTTVTPNASAQGPGTREDASGTTTSAPDLASGTGLGPKPAWTLAREETGDNHQADVMFFADRIAYVAGGDIRIVKPATGEVTATIPIPADTGEPSPPWAQGDWNGTEVIGVTTHTTVPADGLTPERHRTTVRTYSRDGKQLGAFTHDDDQGGSQFLNGWIVTTDAKSGTTAIRDPQGRTRAVFPTHTGLLDGSNNLGVHDIQGGHWAFAYTKDAAGLRNLDVYDLAAGGGPKWGTAQKAPRDAQQDTNISPAVWGVLEDHVLLQWPGGDVYEYDVRTGQQQGRIGAADDRHAIWDADHLLFYSVDGSRAYAYDLTSHRRTWQQDADQRTFYPETYLAGRLYGAVGSSDDASGSGSGSGSGDTSSTVVLDAASHQVLAQNQSFHIKGMSNDGFAAVEFDHPDNSGAQDSAAPYVVYRVAAAPRSGN